ncbi:unnamed protein product [Caenorhabditis brenneri]
MFSRGVLLLCVISLIECGKVHDVVKNIGKRFENNQNLKAYAHPEPRGSWIDPCTRSPECQFTKYTDDHVRKLKLNSALNVRNVLYQAASTQNKYFEKALARLHTISDPEMTAEICEDGVKKLNAYQYLKHVFQTASLFYETPNIDWRYQIEDTPRDVLRFHTHIVQFDKKFNLSAQIHYDITMKVKPQLKDHGTFFAITHVYQGGVCPEHGAFVYRNDDAIDVVIDNIEDLKNHPTSRILLDFFVPLTFQFEDVTKRRISSFRILGLKEGKSKLSVCQHELKDSVVYTVGNNSNFINQNGHSFLPEQFKAWFSRFQMMWHPKKDEDYQDEEFAELKVEKIEENQIIAMVTLKLQLGLNEKVLDWNFKVSAVKVSFHWIIETLHFFFQDPSAERPEWYIDTLEVPCNLDYNYKDESFAAIRDVIGTAFVEDLVELPDPSQWYSTIQFANQFMKHGTRTFEYCDHRKTTANVSEFFLCLKFETKKIFSCF